MSRAPTASARVRIEHLDVETIECLLERAMYPAALDPPVLRGAGRTLDDFQRYEPAVLRAADKSRSVAPMAPSKPSAIASPATSSRSRTRSRHVATSTAAWTPEMGTLK